MKRRWLVEWRFYGSPEFNTLRVTAWSEDEAKSVAWDRVTAWSEAEAKSVAWAELGKNPLIQIGRAQEI